MSERKKVTWYEMCGSRWSVNIPRTSQALRDAAGEIRQLRRQNETLEAGMRVFRVFEAMLVNLGARGYSQAEMPCQAHACEELASELDLLPKNSAATSLVSWGSEMEAAWGLIANAFGGDWEKASPEWREAAAKWRDANMPKIALLWPEAHHVDDPGGPPEQFARIPEQPALLVDGDNYRARMQRIAEWAGGTFEQSILGLDVIRFKTGYEAKAGDVIVKRPSGTMVAHSAESFEKNYRPVE